MVFFFLFFFYDFFQAYITLNPCLSLPSDATDDKKQSQCPNIVLKTNLDHLFENSIDAKKLGAF